MAYKNHDLDGEIIRAATEEFLACGFEKASMRKIAAERGITVGAIYTRYPSKDKLFSSLVQPFVNQIKDLLVQLKTEYYKDITKGSEYLVVAMEKETEAIMKLIYDNYTMAVLLMCRSKGSSMEDFFDILVEEKIKETQEFFNKGKQEKSPDERILKVLIRGQYRIYYHIVKEGYEQEEAKEIMKQLLVYSNGGWRALLSE